MTTPTRTELTNQDKIKLEVKRLQARQPNLTFAHAYELVRKSNPSLVEDEPTPTNITSARTNSDSDSPTQAEIKRRIKAMQIANPKREFKAAWNLLQKTHPHLFESPESNARASAPSLPPGMTFQETMKLYRTLSPAQLVQANLVGMTEDGTPWDKDITWTCLVASEFGNPATGRPISINPNRPILSRPFDHTVQPKPKSPLDKRVSELMSQNTGMSLREVMEFLRHTEPQLFNDDEQPNSLAKRTEAQAKQQALHDAVQKTRLTNPELGFSEAYDQTVKDHPELLSGMVQVISDLD